MKKARLFFLSIFVTALIWTFGACSSPEQPTGESGGEKVAGGRDAGSTDTSPPDENFPRKIVLESGRAKLTITLKNFSLTLERGGEQLFRLNLDDFRLGTVGRYDPKYNYDPYWLYPPKGKKPTYPIGFQWVTPTKATLEKKVGNRLEFLLHYTPSLNSILRIETYKYDSFFIRWTPPQNKNLVMMQLRLNVDKGENYYGLGEYYDSVTHRGKIRTMQFEIDPQMESFNNEAHVPVPFFVSTRGWGTFVRSYRPGIFDMASTEEDKVQITYHARKLEFFFMTASHPLEIPGIYTRITGAPALPAPWAFGVLFWRDEHRDQAQVLEDLQNIRKHDLAVSGLWIDRPYDTAVNDFSFDPKRYPDPKGMIEKIHRMGFRLGLWSTPYAEPKSKHHNYIKGKGWFVSLPYKFLNKWSEPLDFTNPDAFRFWQSLIDRYIKMGISGFKLDYGEDIQIGLGLRRLNVKFHNGEDEQTMHHRYALFYHRAYAERLPADGGFLLCRGGTFGSQQYASIIWPGDLDVGWQKHRTCSDDLKGKCHVGGLIASLIAGLSLSQSGFPLYGSDTGGYRHGRPTKELFIRWFQQTALWPIMQFGGADPNVNPWDFKKYGNSQFDQETLDLFRYFSRLHVRLFPYFYTYAVAAQKHRPGPVRPYGLAFPKENYHPDDQYLLGDYILVAPIVEPKEERDIRLPKGINWIDWWSKEGYTGGKTLKKYPVPLQKIPIFLKEGTILPLLRPDIDTLAATDDKDIVSFPKKPSPLHLIVVPGKDAKFTLFDGTTLELINQGGEIKLDAELGTTFLKGLVIEIWRIKEVTSVKEEKQGALIRYKKLENFKNCDLCWLLDGEILKIKPKEAEKYSFTIRAKINKEFK